MVHNVFISFYVAAVQKLANMQIPRNTISYHTENMFG